MTRVRAHACVLLRARLCHVRLRLQAKLLNAYCKLEQKFAIPAALQQEITRKYTYKMSAKMHISCVKTPNVFKGTLACL